MNGDSSGAGSFDVRAVGMGVLWGIALMLLGAMAQGIIAHSNPVPQIVETLSPWLWQGVGALLSGFLAARRAQGTGWLHGAVAGMSLVLAIAAIMGVVSALPTMAALLKAAGIGTGAGLIGGIAGVNLNR